MQIPKIRGISAEHSNKLDILLSIFTIFTADFLIRIKFVRNK